MQKSSDNFSLDDAMRLANSPAGKQLLQILKQSDPVALQNAVDMASAGDYAKAKESLSGVLASVEMQDLLRQLGG